MTQTEIVRRLRVIRQEIELIWACQNADRCTGDCSSCARQDSAVAKVDALIKDMEPR